MKTHRSKAHRRRGTGAGFTLLELLVVSAVVGLIVLAVNAVIRDYIPRYQLRQTMTMTSQVIHRARLEAIRRGVTTVVVPDYETRELMAFAEVNGDPLNPMAPGAQYLRFDPDETMLRGRTDYLIVRLDLPGKRFGGINFGGPDQGIEGADSIDGLTAVPGAAADDPNVLVFTSFGLAEDPGAFRFMDPREANVLEARVTGITGKVETRKYLLDNDSPTATAGFFPEATEVFEANGTVSKNIWVWY